MYLLSQSHGEQLYRFDGNLFAKEMNLYHHISFCCRYTYFTKNQHSSGI